MQQKCANLVQFTVKQLLSHERRVKNLFFQKTKPEWTKSVDKSFVSETPPESPTVKENNVRDNSTYSSKNLTFHFTTPSFFRNLTKMTHDKYQLIYLPKIAEGTFP